MLHYESKNKQKTIVERSYITFINSKIYYYKQIHCTTPENVNINRSTTLEVNITTLLSFIFLSKKKICFPRMYEEIAKPVS